MYRESEMGFSVKTKKDAKALEAEHAANEASAMKALRKMMRPELVNRFDSIITFNALSEKDVNQIFDNMIENLKKRLAEKSIGLQLTDAARKKLIERGYDSKNGARPLRREIEDDLESLIADNILQEKLDKGDIAKVDYKKDAFTLSVVKE
jgi:ATP-dependent Clp protease ATP-binding subunit ClpC